jgi:hypothetical protein
VLKREMFVPAMLFAVVILWIAPACAQDTLWWSRTYGGSEDDYCYSARQTTDGGYIVVGQTHSFDAFGGGDVYLIKTDPNGNTVWNRTYGGFGGDLGWSVQQTTDGGYMVAGNTALIGPDPIVLVYLIKTDSFGDTLWTRIYGSTDYPPYSYGLSIQQTADGGYIVTGYTGLALPNAYLMKTDSRGDTLWARTYGGSGVDEGLCVQQTTDGGYIVAGFTESFGAGGQDVYLVKTESTGDTTWTRTYGSPLTEVGYSVQQTTDRGYIVAGWALDALGDSYVYLVKISSIGRAMWAHMYGPGHGWQAKGYSVQQTTDGGYIVVGESSGFGGPQVYVVKTDSLGDALWSHTYGDVSGAQAGVSAQQTADGGYMVAGWTESYGAGNRDMMLTKLDSLGNACIGESDLPTVMAVSPTVTGPATQVGFYSLTVTSSLDTVTSPPTEVTTVCVAMRGDANGDGVINVADAIYLLNYLFKGDPPPNPLEAGDADCDGVVNLEDVIYLLNYLFKNGPPPCEP